MSEPKKIIIAYLACPYTHENLEIRKWRLEAARHMAYYFIHKGQFVYSPLTHNMSIDSLGIHGDWQTWRDFDQEMIARCDKLIVLRLPGWTESRGVQDEIAYAKALDKPIEEVDLPKELELRVNTLFAQKSA